MHSRSVERDLLKRKLEAGVNVHMPAPRRIGKTWTINRLAEDLRNQGWLVVELDVQGISCPETFARRLCQKIQGQLPPTAGLWVEATQRFKNMIGGDWNGSPLEALGRLDAIPFLEALIEQLATECEKSAIFIDEIAYFVLALSEQDSLKAKQFFYRLRGIQLANPTIRWLVTGSIGLDLVAERFGLGGAFVDLERFTLEPFDETAARSFLRDESTQIAFNHRFRASDDDLSYVFSELGWLAPYYLKLIGNEVCPSGKEVDGVLTATRADFDEAFRRLLDPSRKSDFAVWKEHIDKNFPQPDKKIARELLSMLSQESSGETIDTLIANFPVRSRRELLFVLNILQNDGLVQEFEGRYRFRSGLIRRHWKEYETE